MKNLGSDLHPDYVGFVIDKSCFPVCLSLLRSFFSILYGSITKDSVKFIDCTESINRLLKSFLICSINIGVVVNSVCLLPIAIVCRPTYSRDMVMYCVFHITVENES